jgi:WD40 repeat protein
VGWVLGRVVVWDASAGRPLATLAAHQQYVTGLSFGPGGRLLATGSWDGTMRLWESATGRLLLTLPHGLAWIGFSPDGGVLGADWDGDRLRLVELADAPEYQSLVGGPGGGEGGLSVGRHSPRRPAARGRNG